MKTNGDQIDRRVAIITGAGSGIGAASARRLSGAGMRVVLAGLLPEELDEVRGNLADAEAALAVPIDLTQPGAASRLVAITEESFGPPDILVNAAGMAWMVPAEDLEMSDWHRVFSINIHALFELTQATGRRMIERRSGAIVNIASMAGLHGMPDHAAYVASKHAVVGLTKALAIEWARYGIRVNCLCPGVTETEMVRKAMVQAPEVWQGRVSRTLWGRLATPDEQASMIEFMVSREASYVSGLIANVDGGNHGLYSGYAVPRHLS